MARFVRVLNETQGTQLAARCRLTQGLVQRVLGLHVQPRLQAGDALLLPGAQSIDTLFMGYPIDLVFVDGSLRVTRVVDRLRPWRMVPWAGNGSRDCIELPAGAAAASRTAIGDQLRFEQAEAGPEPEPEAGVSQR